MDLLMRRGRGAAWAFLKSSGETGCFLDFIVADEPTKLGGGGVIVLNAELKSINRMHMGVLVTHDRARWRVLSS